MKKIADIYREYVISPQLERRELLQALAGLVGSRACLLYPGCFVHITPSFVFQHVVYVDQSDFAERFFFDERAVTAVVNDHRRYGQSPYLRFVHQDFAQPLHVADESMDVVLSLYTGGVAQSCVRYLRVGGMLLTDDHHQDARQAQAHPQLTLCAVMDEVRGTVRVREESRMEDLRSTRASRKRADDSARAYYLFRKTKPASLCAELLDNRSSSS